MNWAIKKGGRTALVTGKDLQVTLQDFQVFSHHLAAAPLKIESHELAFLQSVDTGAAESHDVDEDIFPVLGFDRADPSAFVEPFHVSMQHGVFFPIYRIKTYDGTHSGLFQRLDDSRVVKPKVLVRSQSELIIISRSHL
jgi:hypothetical protein